MRGRWPGGRTAVRTGRERGASGVEYAALVMVGAALLGAMFTAGIPGRVVGSVQQAVCGIFQGDCQETGSAGTTASGGGEGGGAGGGFGRGRPGAPLAAVQRAGSWLIPGTPAADPGQDNGEAARDIWNDEDRDWDDRIEDINDLLTSDAGADYNGEFFAALGAGNTIEIFGGAFYEYDENHDGILDESELARARDELGPLGVRLGDALWQGTLPPEFRDRLLNGDPRALALLIDLYPRSFPPEFVSAAAESILADPMDPRLGNDPDLIYEVQIRAVHALGQNPVAAQHFLGEEGNVNLLATYSGDERKPGYVTAVFDAALGFDVGGAGHQRAMANIADAGEDGAYWFLNGEQYADARRVVAENLEPYLPWMSRVAQRDVGRHPGSTNPPGPPLPTSGENMIELLGGLMGDSDSRQIVHRMAEDFIGQQAVAADFADGIPRIEAGDLDGFMDEQREALETTHVVGGLARMVVLGQNAAHMSEQERIDARLGLYDTITDGLTIGLSEGAGALAPSGAAIPASVGTELVLNDVFGRGRRMLEDALENNVPDSVDAAETIVNRIADPAVLRQQLAEEGIENPEHRRIMAEEISLILQGELLPAMLRIIDES